MKLIKLTQQELNEKIYKHSLWLEDITKGGNLDLSYHDCYGLNFCGADMRYADIRYADIRYANMRYANMSCADMRYVNMSCADMRYVNMICADMRYADMRYADMRYVNMSCVNMSCADMRYAMLYNTIGNGKEIKTIQTEKYTINLTKNIIQIGCENHTIEEWFKFTDSKISEMDSGALEWWNKWKGAIKSFIDAS